MNLFCRDCRKMFIFSEREQNFFSAKKWADPVRCPECRKLHKEKQRDPYFGWQGSMRTAFTRKQRHTRVHYPPHVVGGFR